MPRSLERGNNAPAPESGEALKSSSFPSDETACKDAYAKTLIG